MDGAVRSMLMLPDGRQADAAGDGSSEVGEDVAEEVVGDDDVEAGGVGDHEDRGGVDVQVVVGDLGEFLGHGLDSALPQVPGEDQDVVLVDQGDVLARTLAGAAEGITDNALHAVGGVEGDLGGNLVRGAGAQGAAVAHIGTFGTFADHDEIDGAGVGQRAADACRTGGTGAG